MEGKFQSDYCASTLQFSSDRIFTIIHTHKNIEVVQCSIK